jgi:uncharacterized repeat protein (TIGR02543 family)
MVYWQKRWECPDLGLEMEMPFFMKHGDNFSYHLYIFLVLLMVFVVGWGDGNEKYIVSFDSQGGSEVIPQTINSGGLATMPEAPTRSGYIFGGWYLESDCTTPWDFGSNTVDSDVILYAKWATVSFIASFDSQGVVPLLLKQ